MLKPVLIQICRWNGDAADLLGLAGECAGFTADVPVKSAHVGKVLHSVGIDFIEVGYVQPVIQNQVGVAAFGLMHVHYIGS
ncbi:hypothetical protein D3C76_1697780 [compost metagenome]